MFQNSFSPMSMGKLIGEILEDPTLCVEVNSKVFTPQYHIQGLQQFIKHSQKHKEEGKSSDISRLKDLQIDEIDDGTEEEAITHTRFERISKPPSRFGFKN